VPYIDLIENKVNHVYKYPSIDFYTNNLRIEGAYYMYAHNFNPDSGFFVYSFFADDSLRITDFNGREFSKLAKSEFLGEIDPYLEQDKDYSDEEYEFVFLKKKFYAGILYDKYKKKYYRFYKNGVHSDDIKKSNTIDEFYHREYGVMVFDANFNKTGEYLIPKGVYDIKNIFVSPHGLCILNQKKCMENEDMMYYDIFDL
jgi:hypothetical protein